MDSAAQNFRLKVRARNVQEITKEKRYTMGALPPVCSKLKIKETRKHIDQQKKETKIVTAMRTI